MEETIDTIIPELIPEETEPKQFVIKKNIITKEKRREYNKKFYEVHKNQDHKRDCEVCGGKFTIFNRSHHNQSAKHKNKLLITGNDKN